MSHTNQLKNFVEVENGWQRVESNTTYNVKTGQWEPVLPEPYYYGLLSFLWKRVTGWTDEYGRKAQVKFFEFSFSFKNN